MARDGEEGITQTYLARDCSRLSAFRTMPWLFRWIMWLFPPFKGVFGIFRDDSTSASGGTKTPRGQPGGLGPIFSPAGVAVRRSDDSRGESPPSSASSGRRGEGPGP